MFFNLTIWIFIQAFFIWLLLRKWEVPYDGECGYTKESFRTSKRVGNDNEPNFYD